MLATTRSKSASLWLYHFIRYGTIAFKEGYGCKDQRVSHNFVSYLLEIYHWMLKVTAASSSGTCKS